jgi:hypothetical protein
MESKTTELIGTAVAVLSLCGALFGWILGKLLKSKESEVGITLDLTHTKEDVKQIKEDVRDIKLKMTEIEIELNKS